MSLTQDEIRPSIQGIHVKELSTKYGKVEVIAEQSLELTLSSVSAGTSSWLMVRYINDLYKAPPTLSNSLFETVESWNGIIYVDFSILYNLQYLLFEPA